MKASEAPEKIYISPNSEESTYYVSNQYNRIIEYVRTDAFIEKAQSFFRQSHHLFHLDGMDLHDFIEDFKKYMGN